MSLRQMFLNWTVPILVGGGFSFGLFALLRTDSPDVGTLVKELTKRSSMEVLSASLKGPSVPLTPSAGELRKSPPAPKVEQLKEVIARPVIPPSPLLVPLAERLDPEWMAVMVDAGMPVLYASVIQGDRASFWKFLKGGVWVDERTPGGDTVLGWVMRQDDEESLLDLVTGGVDLQLPPREGQEPLFLATLRRKHDQMSLLLSLGVPADVRSVRPIDPDLVEEVVIRDLKRSLMEDEGLTPLMVCASKGDVDGVVMLMDAGAKLNTYTRREKTYPVNFAMTQRYIYISQLLLGRRPGDEPELRMVVDLSRQRGTVYRDGEAIDSTAVSTGKKGYSTPTGTFVITNKYKDWTSTLYDARMPYFMRLNCGAIGLHAGNVPGYPASHGCIRLPSSKARELFGVLRHGDVVEIIP